ncbi:DapH/DapD/GlmU-related protein [Petrocella sp. FN5]|nr:DapH/DapD/GlmU-related protein [Petrocella sp. FN5]MDF1617246.1 DapH/DapD/GlmU-related protein [Petrocella sp. FN5]
MKNLYLMLYYLIGKRMPSSDGILTFGSKRIRAFLVKRIFDVVGQDVNIEKNVFFGKGRGISIGDRSGVGINARIQGPLSIGKYVMMGPDVIIYTRNHNIQNISIPMMDSGETPPKPVVIEDDVWIGARAIILPGIRIGQGAVIGAGAVVTKDVANYDIVGGVPAKIIGNRNHQPL